MPKVLHPQSDVEPDMRPLGLIAVGLAFLALLLALSVLLSPVGAGVGVAAAALGAIARGHERSHTLGNAALVLSGVAVVGGVVAFVDLLLLG